MATQHRDRMRLTLTVEGFCYSVVLGFICAGAIFREFNLLILLAGMMTGPWLLSIWLAPYSLRGLEVERLVPDEAGAGEVVSVHLTVRNRRRWIDGWAVQVEDRLQCTSATGRQIPSSFRVLIPRAAANHATDAGYRTRLMRRGRYRAGPLLLTTRMPLGLWRAAREIPDHADFIIYPRLGELTPAWHRRMTQLEAIGPSSISQQGTMDGDYYGLRNWRSGDSRRWIHWRTSARRTELAVRQFERQTNQDLTLLLDLRCPPGDEQRCQAVEQAISFVASVVADSCRRGHSRLALGTTGQSPRWMSGYASAGVRRDMLQWLAVAPLHSDDLLPELVDLAASQVGTRQRLLLISCDFVDLSDTHRFGSLWHDPVKQRLLGRLDRLHVRHDDFRQFFALPALPTEIPA